MQAKSIINTSAIHKAVMNRTSRRVQRLEVKENETGVLLKGLAPSYHVKQLAQEAVMKHGFNVTNEIDVV